ncbi:four-helix bundle copper-binding protein [Ramlibacter monticola]|jgi:Cys-rich four helix bundle protein (predicted Tat secretion target)|uniref:Four-helix bundle copper-binding protein n=1 Tax=Ramlibacter monticola TaxID=1926872 RepID=A0A936Z2Z8_9BURK|nr:four-helix bundle copper-binding protein [Ramlibacter monticola]MBL0392617.1 four-helix bundle copper-binding protein [Ramlibacter monticola]
MDRREALQGVVALTAVAAAANASAQQEQHHHHHGGGKYAALMETAGDCVKTGETCLTHCHDSLATGDKSLGQCAKRVSELMAACSALRSLAAQNSRFVPQYARLTMQVCDACEKECRKHASKHESCNACAESCAACSKECKALTT